MLIFDWGIINVASCLSNEAVATFEVNCGILTSSTISGGGCAVMGTTANMSLTLVVLSIALVKFSLKEVMLPDVLSELLIRYSIFAGWGMIFFSKLFGRCKPFCHFDKNL